MSAGGERSSPGAAAAGRRRWGSRHYVVLLGLALLALVPPVVEALDEPFYLDLFARLMIFAIAAVSLDLILGYGGMISFGHAAYLGIGGYAVGIFSFYGIDSGFLQWPVAIGASALVAFVIGAVSLRTSGMYFIMITLAFTQMLYFLGISLETYGGDDGMTSNRSEFGGLLDLYDPDTFYYLVFAILLLVLGGSYRLVNSRFGMVIRGARSNERRMRAIGFPTLRYRLVAFTISGAICGVAGALLANLTEFITPEFMHWTRSAELMFMVILGGMGTLFGAVLGTAAYLMLEEVLSGYTLHWHIILGPVLILVVLFAKRGIFGSAAGGAR